MTGRLSGKHCFVTGAGQGIGHAIARLFAAEGAVVTGADLGFPLDLPETVTPLVLDVTDEQAVNEAASASPEVSVLVNCVGLVANGTALECSMADFDRSMMVNVRSMALTVRAFLPAMLAREDGAIVNIASVVSSVTGAPNRFAYGTSKAAVLGLTKSIAADYVTRGIRCNAISPGTVESPSLLDRFAATGDAEAARRAFVARQPMGRLGKVEEIAAAAVLLASDEGKFMTGTNIVIDGGWTL